jgi:hypothetical protein
VDWGRGLGGFADAGVARDAQGDAGTSRAQRASDHPPEEDAGQARHHMELVMRQEQGLKRTSSKHGEAGFGAAWNERCVARRQYVNQMLD